MEKQTVVEWLVEKLDNLIEYYPSQFEQVNKAFEQAKAMEKEQIMKAFDFGVYDGGGIIKKYKMSGEKYYNETFKSE
jgi:hypothetical protein